MKYLLRVERNGQKFRDSGEFDLEISAIDYASKMFKKYEMLFPEKKPQEYNDRKGCEFKLKYCNFVHVWSLEDIKCYIIKG